MPGSTLRYGSSLSTETEIPLFFRIRPMDATLMPFPTELTTPPVTKTNLVIRIFSSEIHLLKKAASKDAVSRSRLVSTTVTWATEPSKKNPAHYQDNSARIIGDKLSTTALRTFSPPAEYMLAWILMSTKEGPPMHNIFIQCFNHSLYKSIRRPVIHQIHASDFIMVQVYRIYKNYMSGIHGPPE